MDGSVLPRVLAEATQAYTADERRAAEDSGLWEPVQVLHIYGIKDSQGRIVLQALIRWRGVSREESSPEPVANFLLRFPELFDTYLQKVVCPSGRPTQADLDEIERKRHSLYDSLPDWSGHEDADDSQRALLDHLNYLQIRPVEESLQPLLEHDPSAWLDVRASIACGQAYRRYMGLYGSSMNELRYCSTRWKGVTMVGSIAAIIDCVDRAAGELTVAIYGQDLEGPGIFAHGRHSWCPPKAPSSVQVEPLQDVDPERSALSFSPLDSPQRAVKADQRPLVDLDAIHARLYLNAHQALHEARQAEDSSEFRGLFTLLLGCRDVGTYDHVPCKHFGVSTLVDRWARLQLLVGCLQRRFRSEKAFNAIADMIHESAGWICMILISPQPARHFLALQLRLQSLTVLVVSSVVPPELRDTWSLVHAMILICANCAYIAYRAPKPVQGEAASVKRSVNRLLLNEAYNFGCTVPGCTEDMSPDQAISSMEKALVNRWRFSCRVPFSRSGSDLYRWTCSQLGWPVHELVACSSGLFDRPSTPTFLTFLVSVAQPAHAGCKTHGGKYRFTAAPVIYNQPISWQGLTQVPVDDKLAPEKAGGQDVQQKRSRRSPRKTT